MSRKQKFDAKEGGRRREEAKYPSDTISLEGSTALSSSSPFALNLWQHYSVYEKKLCLLWERARAISLGKTLPDANQENNENDSDYNHILGHIKQDGFGANDDRKAAQSDSYLEGSWDWCINKIGNKIDSIEGVISSIESNDENPLKQAQVARHDLKRTIECVFYMLPSVAADSKVLERGCETAIKEHYQGLEQLTTQFEHCCMQLATVTGQPINFVFATFPADIAYFVVFVLPTAYRLKSENRSRFLLSRAYDRNTYLNHGLLIASATNIKPAEKIKCLLGLLLESKQRISQQWFSSGSFYLQFVAQFLSSFFNKFKISSQKQIEAQGAYRNLLTEKRNWQQLSGQASISLQDAAKQVTSADTKRLKNNFKF